MITLTPNNIQVPYLRTTREFPLEPNDLQDTLSKTYIEISLAVNKRTIGLFLEIQTVTGNQYFALSNNDIHNPIQFRQSYRQVYQLAALPDTSTATIISNIQ